MNSVIYRLSQFFANTPILNAIFLIIALLSILLAVFFYIKSRKVRYPTYLVRNVSLVEENIGKIKDIKISYFGSNVKNLSVARVALWNKGKETINKKDVAQIDPLTISAANGNQLLGIEILYKKNISNNFSIDPIDDAENPGQHLQNKLRIDFDYFDKDEGIVLQVFHSGKSSSDILIDGTVKGHGKINRVGSPLFKKIYTPFDVARKLKRKHRKLLLGITMALTPIVLVISVLLPHKKTVNSFWNTYLPTAFFTLLYWSMALSVLIKRVPKGFEMFEDEIKPL
jgi:hypothetical protein